MHFSLFFFSYGHFFDLQKYLNATGVIYLGTKMRLLPSLFSPKEKYSLRERNNKIGWKLRPLVVKYGGIKNSCNFQWKMKMHFLGSERVCGKIWEEEEKDAIIFVKPVSISEDDGQWCPNHISWGAKEEAGTRTNPWKKAYYISRNFYFGSGQYI